MMQFLAIISVSLLLATVNANIQIMPYSESVTLNCSDIAATHFYSVLNGTKTQITNGGKFTITNDGVMTITDLRSNELKYDYQCENNVTNANKFFETKSTPYMYAQEKTSLTVSENGVASFKCRMISGFADGQTLKWSWLLNNEELSNNDRFTVSGNDSTSELAIKDARLTDKGIYTCLVENGYGNYSQVIELKVKTAWAALYPFLGIVVEVIILSLMIIFYEARTKRKAKQAEDLTEQRGNLIDEKGQEGSDELKKRSVKA